MTEIRRINTSNNYDNYDNYGSYELYYEPVLDSVIIEQRLPIIRSPSCELDEIAWSNRSIVDVCDGAIVSFDGDLWHYYFVDIDGTSVKTIEVVSIPFDKLTPSGFISKRDDFTGEE